MQIYSTNTFAIELKIPFTIRTVEYVSIVFGLLDFGKFLGHR
jgi:hypothetical protein